MFEDPCLAPSNYVDAAAIRRYNFFKGFVLIALAALLLGLWRFNSSYQNPTITSPSGIVAPGSATLAGTGAPGSTIDLRLNGTSIGETTVAGDGRWSFNSAALAAGGYELLAVGFDADGLERGQATPQTFTVEARNSDTPEISYSAPTLSLPAADVDPEAITITGMGTPGSTVELFQNGTSVGTAVVGDDGTYRFTVAADGETNAFEAVGFDPAGSDIGRSGIASLTIPRAIAPLTMNTPELGEFSLGNNGLPSGRFTVSGEGEPGSSIEIELDGQLIGSTTVGEDGTWAFDGSLSNPAGNYRLTARQRAANRDDAQTAAAEVTVPLLGNLTLAEATASELGDLSLNGTGIPGSEIEIVIDGQVVDSLMVAADGSWSWRSPTRYDAGDYQTQVRQAGVENGSPAAQTVRIDPFIRINDVTVAEMAAGAAEVTINGQTLPNSAVQLFIDSEPVEPVTANAEGNWSYTTTLNQGSYVVKGQVGDGSGNPVAEATDRATVGNVTGALQIVYGGSSDMASDPEGSTSVTLAGVPAVEIILDASWSMTKAFVNTNRFTGAQRALEDIVNEVLPEGTPFALRIFGNIEGNLACRTDLMVPYGALDRTAVKEIIQAAAPQFNANTPIAASLSLVAQDLAEAAEEERIVVLLTDGEETCDGDPAAAIKELVNAGFNVQINIVGLSIVDEALKSEFARWAELGGGTYYDVSNPGQLGTALRSATGAFFTVKAANGESIATGRVGGRPLALPPGTYTVEVRTGPNTIIEAVEIDDEVIQRIVLR